MKKPPFQIINAPTKNEWRSSGVREKPKSCNMCRFLQRGSGFCPDDSAEKARIAILLPYPRNEDVIDQKALSSGTGWYFLKNFVYSLGHKREELLVTHCIRCVPPTVKGKYVYPPEVNKDQIENTCRAYDKYHGCDGRLVPTGIAEWDPNVVICSFDPSDIFQTVALYRPIRETMKKAWAFAEEGYRPLVLMGKEPMQLCAPWLDPNPKRFNGHFEELPGWPFKSKNQRGFNPG